MFKMETWKAAVLVLCSYALLVNCQKCDDIDSSACKLLQASRPNLCSDLALAQASCPRFCKLCPLECYDCNATVLDYHECNTTTLCADGEVCMKKELRSVVDGHHEYQMTCERKELCDGAGVVFPFGKRAIVSRDVSLTCCTEDFCNYPQHNVVNGCGKDIIFMVDESNPNIKRYSTEVISLIFHTVNQLKIGMNESLVGLYSYDIQTQEKFDLQQHTDRFSLLRALQTTHFSSPGFFQGRPDTDEALQFLLQQGTTPKAGDRQNYRDVIVFIVDETHAGTLNSALIRQVQNLSNDVIIVGVGSGAGSSNIEQLATDNNHIFHVRSYATLERESLKGLASMLVRCT